MQMLWRYLMIEAIDTPFEQDQKFSMLYSADITPFIVFNDFTWKAYWMRPNINHADLCAENAVMLVGVV
jgi:hypothetical protein